MSGVIKYASGGAAGAGAALLPAAFPAVAVAGARRTGETAGVLVGACAFDPTEYPTPGGGAVRTIKVQAVLECAVAGQTCTLTVYNETDLSAVATLTTQAEEPTLVESAALVVPDDLPAARKLYGFYLSRTGGSANDEVACHMAQVFAAFTE